MLIVEDYEDDALLLLRELRRGGYDTEYELVDTPEAMKQALASSEWDVIVSDYQLPRFDAPHALKIAREAGSDAPFVVVSGRIGEETAVQAMKAGAHDYVMKDNLARLCATVERGIEEAGERKRAERDLRRRDAILEAVRFAAECFLGNPTNCEKDIDEVLERLGEAAEVSRVYVFQNRTAEDGGLWNHQLHKWEAADAPPGAPEADFPYRDDGSGRWRDFGRWEEVMGRGEPVYGNVRDFPESERPMLVGTLGIRSMILVPIFVEGEWWGFIGFDDCVVERDWSAAEIDALKAAASTLGAALRRGVVEEELRASETRYRAVIERATDGIYLLDAASRRLLETNPAFQRMLGYTEGELRGMEVYDFVAHPRENVEATIQRTLERKRRLVGDRIYRRKDGTLLDVEVGVSVISYGGRDVICTIARDVTERKKKDESLRQSERLYRAVMEQATENIFLVDVETLHIVESNSAFRQALGYSEEELSTMTLYDVVAADRESVEANVRLVVELRYPFVGERQYRRKDGSLLYVEVSASVILRDDRRTLCVVAHDITERAKAQQLLEGRVTGLSSIASNVTLDLPMKEMLDALAESAVRAGTAVACAVVLVGEKAGMLHLFGSHGLPEGYTDGLQLAYKFDVWSPSLQAFRTRQPVLTRDIRDFLLSEPLYAPIHRFVREVPWDVTYSLPLVSRGRALGAISFCFLPGQEPAEDERVFLGAVADQTAVAVENARLFAEARGKAALEERQKLARELHDSVSQALYGIALGSKAARERLEDGDPEQLAEPLDYVLSLAEAGMAEMRALIFELRPESLESEGLVAALEKQVAALEARHGIEVEHDLCEEPSAPLPAKETVYRIAQEALHNVVKHARAKRVRLTLECDLQRIGIEVSDDGLGFDSQDDFPGHLGLRSMRERAARSGGTFEIESVPGEGTRVRVRIPV